MAKLDRCLWDRAVAATRRHVFIVQSGVKSAGMGLLVLETVSEKLEAKATVGVVVRLDDRPFTHILLETRHCNLERNCRGSADFVMTQVLSLCFEAGCLVDLGFTYPPQGASPFFRCLGCCCAGRRTALLR